MRPGSLFKQDDLWRNNRIAYVAILVFYPEEIIQRICLYKPGCIADAAVGIGAARAILERIYQFAFRIIIKFREIEFAGIRGDKRARNKFSRDEQRICVCGLWRELKSKFHGLPGTERCCIHAFQLEVDLGPGSVFFTCNNDKDKAQRC